MFYRAYTIAALAVLLVLTQAQSAWTQTTTLRDPEQVYGSLGPLDYVAYFPGTSDALLCVESSACYRTNPAGGPLHAITTGGNAHALSPSGTRMLVGRAGGTTAVVETTTGQWLNTLTQQGTSTVLDVAFAPNGDLVAVTGQVYSSEQTAYVGYVAVYDLAESTSLFSVQTVERPHSVAFSPDNASVLVGGYAYDAEASAYRGRAELREVLSGALTRTFEDQHSYVYDIAFSPDGGRIAAAGELLSPSGAGDGGVVVWNTTTAAVETVLENGFERVMRTTFSGDGNTLYACGKAFIAVKPLATGTSKVTAWNPANGSIVWSEQGHSDAHIALALSGDGSRLLTGSLAGALLEWDASTGDLLNARLDVAMANAVQDVTFTPDGNQVLTTDNSPLIHVWDRDSGALYDAFSDPDGVAFNSVDVSPNGQYLAASNWGGDTWVWDLNTADAPMNVAEAPAGGWFSRFHPDGGSVFTVGTYAELVDMQVTNYAHMARWDVSDGSLIAEAMGPEGSFSYLSVSPDGQYVAATKLLPPGARKQSSEFTNQVFLYNANTGALLYTFADARFESVNGVDFSPSSSQLAAVGFRANPATDPVVIVWDVVSHEVDYVLDAPASSYMYHVAFSPSGSRLAVSGIGVYELIPEMTGVAGASLLYDVSDGTNTHLVLASPGFVYASAFSPDGANLLTANADYTAKLFDLGGEGEGEGEGECDEYCTEPIDDQDGDGLDDCVECRDFGTDPLDPDSDMDGMPDGWEIEYDLHPTMDFDALEDYDGDGLNNLEEFQRGGDPDDPASPENTVFVSATGSDATGNGSRTTPWASIAHALSQVTATQAAPARISILAGTISENVTLKPFTALTGSTDGASILQGTVAGAANSKISNLQILAPGGASTLLNIGGVRMKVSNVLFQGDTARAATGIAISGAGANGTVIEGCTFTSLAVGIDLDAALPFIRRCFFDDLSSTGILVRGLPTTKSLKNGLGDATSPESGWNTFKIDNIDGFAVDNQTDTELVMENNDWDTDDTTAVDASISGPADFEPILPKGAGIAAATLFCTVWDKDTELRIENASVRLTVSGFAEVTENENGVYAFPAVAPTGYTVTVNAEGYAEKSVPAILSEGAILNVIVPLGTGGGDNGGPSCRPARSGGGTHRAEVILLLSVAVLLAGAGVRARRSRG